ncbi:sialate O-acetylesterase [Halosquirtibacter laminarini]|uniref:Sialate O-acetylesterase n=1 Tax=Halosquirtibacter laminarini TaxID=3374600 RepID=A0AC61NNZ1_9BACT|nr:sialate O-acetylesterase [Prolixibacteraceae bacterium]
MKKSNVTTLCALFLFLLIGCNSSSKKEIHQKTYVVYMAGQSNMVGQGHKDYLSDSIKLSSKVQFFDYALDANMKKSPNKFGPEYGMSEIISKKYPKAKFIFIKYAIGGASQFDWAPEYSKERAAVTGHPEFGDMYSTFFKLINKDIPKGAIPLAVLWMQGERDAVIPEAGREYEENMDHFIRSFRRDIEKDNLPFIIGIIDPEPARYTLKSGVVHSQRELAKNLPNVFTIETSDLPKYNDGVHYNSKGQMALGRRFGEEIIKLIDQKEKQGISF